MIKQLKTLKEMPFRLDKATVVDIYELRNEAVKWIKELQVKAQPLTIHANVGEIWNKAFDAMLYQSKINWIKHFFNITEEDLK